MSHLWLLPSPYRQHSLGVQFIERLDTERQLRDVEQQDVLHVAGDHARLDRGAEGHPPRGKGRPVPLPDSDPRRGAPAAPRR